jgi:hypothetical protein
VDKKNDSWTQRIIGPGNYVTNDVESTHELSTDIACRVGARFMRQ